MDSFTYNGNNKVTQETFANLENEWAYGSSGALTTETWGATTDGFGHSNPSVTALSPAVLSGLGALADGVSTASETNPDGDTTKLQLDNQGRVLLETDANGAQTQTTYSNGFVSTVTDPLGRTTTHLHAGCGWSYPTQITFPDGSTEQFQYQTLDHELTAFTDQNGNETTYAYDSSGHLTST